MKTTTRIEVGNDPFFDDTHTVEEICDVINNMREFCIKLNEMKIYRFDTNMFLKCRSHIPLTEDVIQPLTDIPQWCHTIISIDYIDIEQELEYLKREHPNSLDRGGEITYNNPDALILKK